MSISETDIAVIGMSCHFPGADSVHGYWENLSQGVESIRSISDEELEAEGVDARLRDDPAYVKAGAVLDGVELFDPAFFGISAKDAAIMDPQHRHFLECAWEAFEHAGRIPADFSGAIGVFAGCGMGTYFMHNLLTNPALLKSVGWFLLRHTGNDKDFLSTLVSYKLDLTGPSVNVQTACSTSLVAIHLACQSLLSGECDMALAGGSTVSVPHRVGYLYQEGEIMSPDGHCRAFDADSKGTVFGSGAGTVLLRRAQDAVEDGDYIHAIIKGSAINNDGSNKAGYLAPSVEGQARAIAEALAVADVEARSVSYVETHGTGTPVGDPIEMAALVQAFRQTTEDTGFCHIGSVKPNIGHLDTAAGVASFIKTTMALDQQRLPPSIGYRRSNPEIDFDSSPFQVNTELRPWPRGSSTRRAGVSSLGVGGTNAHVILEEPPPRPQTDEGRSHQLLTLSAKSKAALDRLASKLAEHFREHPDVLADAAYTLQVGRAGFEHRRTVVCRDGQEAADLLEQGSQPGMTASGQAERARDSVAFMFPGGGAQYPNMARDLYREEPTFRKRVDRGLELLKQHLDEDVRELLFVEDLAEVDRVQTALQRPAIQLPLIFIVEHALAELWMSWGVKPTALIGHSLGENTAACLAGVLSYEDALGLVALRGRLFEEVPSGGMLSVELPARELEKALDPALTIGVINGPDLCVVSGPTEPLDALRRELQQRDVECRPIKISIAAHSPMLDGILDRFGEYLRSIELRPPEIPFVSNVSGDWITDAEATDPDYWVRHLRSTVRFADGVHTLMEGGDRILLEVGPGRTLSSLSKLHPDVPTGHPVFSSLRHPDEKISDMAYLLGVVGRLWCSGYRMDWGSFHRGFERARLPLPSCPFDRKAYWIAPGKVSHESATSSQGLQKQPDLGQWFYRPTWRPEPLDLAGAGSDGPEQRWLVFVDDTGVGDALCKRLRGRGDEVIEVREGDAFYKQGPNRYLIAPETGRKGYDALISDVTENGGPPDRVLHLWTLTSKPKFRPGSSLFHHHQERGFYSLLYLAQAFGDEGVKDSVHLVVVSNGMQRVGGEPLQYPDKATLLGPVKVIPRELEGFSCASIDVVIPDTTNQRRKLFSKQEDPAQGLADELMPELLAPPADAIVARRNGQRFVQVHERTQVEPWDRAVGVREEGVYLVTGGLGALGLAVAEHLGREFRAKLVLLGRSEFPARDIWDQWLATHGPRDPTSQKIKAIRELEHQGAEVMTASADVANLDQMQNVLNGVHERFGAVNGVVHAAGTMDDGIIQLKSEESIARVFSPKVHGTLVLDQVVGQDSPDFMILFSSTSSIVAPAGQVDYTAANCFLNAFARGQAGESCHTVAINWGVWKDVGLASELRARLLGDDVDDKAPHELVEHPMFEERIAASDEASDYVGRISPSNTWVLDQHRVADGTAVFPGTGYLDVMAAAMEAWEGSVGGVSLEDVAFLAPLSCPDDGSRELRVKMLRSGGSYQLQVDSRPAGEPGQWVSHAQAQAHFETNEGPERLDLSDIERRCTREIVSHGGRPIITKQQRHLKFGPQWQVLRWLGLGNAEALAKLEIDPDQRLAERDHPLHPGLLDLATGCALPLVEGYDGFDGVYVPMSYDRVTVLRPLEHQVYSHVRVRGGAHVDREALTFDVTITDEQGRVSAQIEGYTMRRITDTALLSVNDQPSSSLAGLEEANLSAAERLFVESVEAGITRAEGMKVLERVLSGAPQPEIAVVPVDLHTIIERTHAAGAEEGEASMAFARPNLQSEYAPPTDEIERTLVEYWQEFLGVDQIGIHDDFFELGGHSLVAVRLFAKIKKTYKVEYPISVLFEAPTIAKCADMLRREVGEVPEGSDVEVEHDPGYKHLVLMNGEERRDTSPFFLVSGMFGNVLNLRHLAAHLGVAQPVYALQARGLYGDEPPHNRFEHMARDYLAEVRQVQPQGPYYLGGFSGGGITALEMAEQLRQQGEPVGLLVMLDTTPPQVPQLTEADKVKIHLQRLRQQGPRYLARWAKRRWEWESGKVRARLNQADSREPTPAEFRSEQIQNAFIEALDAYEPPAYPGQVVLFRPPLDRTYQLSPDRAANLDREIVDHYNHWKQHLPGEIVVHTVSGDHDSMVLEPHVRGLAASIQALLDQARGRGASRQPYQPAARTAIR